MHTDTTLATAAPQAKKLAERLLTAQRLMMGIVLVLCGVSGALNVLLHTPGVDDAARATGSLIKASFLFPLLKGAEVLLQLWVNKTRQ
jgi:hypothetical protein